MKVLSFALAIAALAPGTARAHEVLHQVEWNRAAAVRATFADGEALAWAEYEVYSPAEPKMPHHKGRTDRDGWLAFVPTTPGTWRVKLVDPTGHGLEVAVDAAAQSLPAPGAPATSTAAFMLRPLVGLAAIAAVFGVLSAVYRRRGASRTRLPRL